MVKSILLTGDKIVLVDDSDYRDVSRYKWYYLGGTAMRRGEIDEPPLMRLSHHLLRPIIGMVVDHRNGNPLDNRRSNLRVCTQKQNMRNRKKAKHSKQPYKGVAWDGWSWRARITVNGRRYNLGSYATAIEAARAYDFTARRLFGEFARTNL